MPPTESQPRVTVVVPVYNGARFLRLSLDSVVAQTYPNLDILVMDDASTDETPEIVASYGDRLRHYRQSRNRGQFDNISDGVEMADGDFIAVYHADDIYSPEIVTREATFLIAHPEARAVFALDEMIDAAGNPRGSGKVRLPHEIAEGGLFDYPTILNVLLLYKNRIFRAPSSMIRAEAYRAAGRYRGREYPVAADFEMFLRVARQGPVGILSDHLFRYRWGHGNADQIDRLVRTGPEPYFAIIEEHLSSGGVDLVRPEAAAAHRAHFAHDQIMRAVNHYILDKRPAGRRLLAEIQLADLWGSNRVDRTRLTLLLALLHVLMRVPRFAGVAGFFFRRWYPGLTDTRQSGSNDPLPWLRERGYVTSG